VQCDQQVKALVERSVTVQADRVADAVLLPDQGDVAGAVSFQRQHTESSWRIALPSGLLAEPGRTDPGQPDGAEQPLNGVLIDRAK
jgi:hypothetical protein